MKVWPVPDSFEKKVPKNGEPGSFWEDRGDRRHCGIDIYAPVGAGILAIEKGIIIDVGIFTSPDFHQYWNQTYYIIIKSEKNILFKYAELGEVLVYVGEKIEAGHLIGNVGQVIKGEDVSYEDPFYVRELADKNNLSMLHLELYKAPVIQVQPYVAGNFFGSRLPESLIDPAYYLNGIVKEYQRQQQQLKQN